jgi:hypothetical protein
MKQLNIIEEEEDKTDKTDTESSDSESSHEEDSNNIRLPLLLLRKSPNSHSLLCNVKNISEMIYNK